MSEVKPITIQDVQNILDMLTDTLNAAGVDSLNGKVSRQDFLMMCVIVMEHTGRMLGEASEDVRGYLSVQLNDAMYQKIMETAHPLQYVVPAGPMQ